MTLVDALVMLALVTAAIGIAYAVYRFARFVRTHGLFNRDVTNPGGGSAFLPLQEFIQPQIQHVEQVKEQRLAKKDDESGSGAEDPP